MGDVLRLEFTWAVRWAEAFVVTIRMLVTDAPPMKPPSTAWQIAGPLLGATSMPLTVTPRALGEMPDGQTSPQVGTVPTLYSLPMIR